MYFLYGKTEVEYLKGKDKILGAVIDEIGHVDRETDTDLFSSVVHHIIGQQISTKAQATIWQRMKSSFGNVNAAAIAEASISELQSFGMTFRKAEYIQDFAKKVQDKEFDLQRPDIFSFDDLAIQRGLRMVYHHRKIDRKLFEKYRRRFSPYCSVASLYLWAVAGGAIPGMKDYAPKKGGSRGTRRKDKSGQKQG